MLIISFIITDLILGFHSVTLFTWGSILLIGLMSKFFIANTKTRISGVLIGASLFFVITNFGVWLIGGYPKNIEGIILCYTMAIPFFGNTISMALIIFHSAVIEVLSLSKKNII